MNSLNRIYKTVRSFVAEFPVGHYLLGPIICLVFLLITIYANDSSDVNYDGNLGRDYFFVSLVGTMAMIITAGVIGSSILGIDWMSRQLKEENRGIRFLSLPLSQAERTAATLFMQWIFFPLITIIPAYLLVVVVYLFLGDIIHMPPPRYLLAAIPVGGVITALLSLMYLFPAIAIPRRAGVVVIGLFILFGVYMAYTRADDMGSIVLEHDAVAFLQQDVVGLSDLDPLLNREPATEFRFNVNAGFGYSGWLGVIGGLLMLAAIIVGLHRKTS